MRFLHGRRKKQGIAADFQQHPPISRTLLSRSECSETREPHLPSPGEDALGMPLEKPLRRMGYRRRLRLCACVHACVCRACVHRCDSVRCSCSTEVLRLLQRSAKEREGQRWRGRQQLHSRSSDRWIGEDGALPAVKL